MGSFNKPISDGQLLDLLYLTLRWARPEFDGVFPGSIRLIPGVLPLVYYR